TGFWRGAPDESGAGVLNIAPGMSIIGLLLDHSSGSVASPRNSPSPALPFSTDLRRKEHAVSVNEQAAPAPLSSDEETLHRLGYARELRRAIRACPNLASVSPRTGSRRACGPRSGTGMAPGDRPSSSGAGR